MLNGQKVGELNRLPPDPRYRTGAFWIATIEQSKSIHHVIGSGRTPEYALADAFEDGVQRLREAVNFAAKVGTRIKRNPKRVSFKFRKGE